MQNKEALNEEKTEQKTICTITDEASNKTLNCGDIILLKGLGQEYSIHTETIFLLIKNASSDKPKEIHVKFA